MLLPMPPLPENFDLARWCLVPGNEQYQRGIHSGSVYHVAKILHDGLAAGPTAEINGLKGVFCFNDDLKKTAVALSSSGYSVHSSLAKDGFLWTVKYELAVAYFLSGTPGVGRMTSTRGNQWVCKPGTYHLMRMWFHAIHQEELHAVKHWVRMDSWHPEYEHPI